jgi:hypothetical protein
MSKTNVFLKLLKNCRIFISSHRKIKTKTLKNSIYEKTLINIKKNGTKKPPPWVDW